MVRSAIAANPVFRDFSTGRMCHNPSNYATENNQKNGISPPKLQFFMQMEINAKNWNNRQNGSYPQRLGSKKRSLSSPRPKGKIGAHDRSRTCTLLPGLGPE
ncbi:MAG: hypothetical protein OSB29_05355, partial [Verrucomicrobiota bacterium]|nr:hypothetical protein [Verrucomicrobiota bacterium]